MIFHSHFYATTLSNSYVIGPEDGGEAVIIDPGLFDTDMLSIIEGNKLYIRYILITHAHEAHIHGIKTIFKIYNAKLFSYRHSILDYKTIKVRDFTKIKCGKFVFEVLETPGHSGDSVTYKFDKFLFTGDTLLAGSIGPVSDGFARGLILSSIKEKILCLEDDYFIFPGHGPPTKLSIEKKYNPDFAETI
ncbi:MAG: MBL fold metallo-hydrolase [Spirochaetales bacterium]|nr:MBL fold metallo-hydrolase [Spirochaetales bacterium]